MADASVFVHAPAKVNLNLHIVDRLDNGYHALDSWVVFSPDIGDRLSLTAADTFSLTVDGPFAGPLSTCAPEDNLISRAALLMAQTLERRADIHIHLEKNLPIAAGIGGGSSDAAAALQGLCLAWDIDDLPSAVQDKLPEIGMDLPACFAGHSLRMHGMGELISPAPKLTFPLHCVLVNSGLACPTPPIFKDLDLVTCQRTPLSLPDQFTDFADMMAYLHGTTNDLMKPAISLAPEIEAVLNTLKATQECALARMSGSGATCFGLYQTAEQAERAAKAIAQTHPTWWVRSGTLY